MRPCKRERRSIASPRPEINTHFESPHVTHTITGPPHSLLVLPSYTLGLPLGPPPFLTGPTPIAPESESSGLPRRFIIFPMEGPWMSASSRPTRSEKVVANATAILTARIKDHPLCRQGRQVKHLAMSMQICNQVHTVHSYHVPTHGHTGTGSHQHGLHTSRHHGMHHTAHPE